MLTEQRLNAIADRVIVAQDNAQTMIKLTQDFPDLSMDDSYDVQDELCRRWQERGERIIGMKAGLTSKAKMVQMGVHEPSYGFLTNAMARPEGGAVAIDEMCHPRVEAEIAFVMKSDLSGDQCTIEDVIAATEFIVPAIEIIDSRYEKFKFDLVSVIADNGSSSRYVTGGRAMDPRSMNLRTIGVVLERNGVIEDLGASAAVLNHPANAIVMMVKHLHRRGRSLRAGSLVLTGGITAAVAVNRGDNVCARFQHMGSVSVRFE